MIRPRQLRITMPRTVLMALGLLVVLLAVGSLDHAPAQADTRPKWVSGESFTLLDLISEYYVGVAVDVTLPRATGDEPLTYSLTPEEGATLPPGVTFNASTRKLTGVPTAVQELTGYNYKVTDADGDTADFDLAIAVVNTPDPPEVPQVLVSNIGETSAQHVDLNWDRAQGFRTGGNRDGYFVTSVELDLEVDANYGSDFTVAIHNPDNQGNPGARVALLNAPSSLATGANGFTPTGRLKLAPSTRYFVVVDSGASNTTVKIGETASDDEVGADGWIINNGSRNRSWNSTGWAKHSGVAYQIRVNGVINTKPEWVHDGTFTVHDLIQEYAVGGAVALSLPRATGDGRLTYSLTPEEGATLPAGLTFDAETLKVTGIPTAAQELTGYTYAVTDRHGDKTKFNFVIAVIVGARQHPLIDDIMSVSWNRSEDSGVTGYLVQWKSGDQQYSTTERSYTAGPDEVSHEISDLPLGVYTVRVTQQGGAGDGSSVEYTVTLHGWPGVVYVDPVAGDAQAIDVEWETVSTAAGYVIEWKLASREGAYPAANRASVAVADLEYRTFTHPTTGETLSFPKHRVSGLLPNTEYEARVTVYTDAGSADDPDGLSDRNSGATHAEITGLTAVAGDENTRLDVSWNAPPDSRVFGFKATGYLLQNKSGSNDYNEGVELSLDRTSATLATLTANTAYTVRLTVKGTLFGGTADGDSAEASGTTGAPVGGTSQDQATGAADGPAGSDEQQSDTTPAVSFVIYYDPNAGDAAVDRYNQAVALLNDAGISYSEVRGDVQAEVDRLAGVTNSIIPRFFLGDPTEQGWVSETKVNNGGLRWLKAKVAELRED